MDGKYVLGEANYIDQTWSFDYKGKDGKEHSTRDTNFDITENAIELLCCSIHYHYCWKTCKEGDRLPNDAFHHPDNGNQYHTIGFFDEKAYKWLTRLGVVNLDSNFRLMKTYITAWGIKETPNFKVLCVSKLKEPVKIVDFLETAFKRRLEKVV